MEDKEYKIALKIYKIYLKEKYTEDVQNSPFISWLTERTQINKGKNNAN